MLRLSIPLVLLAAVSVASSPAQDSRDYNVSVNVELVQLPVSVLDKQGFPVQGLKQEHFAVYEDKVLQDISLFKQEDVPLSVGLVVDVSEHLETKLRVLIKDVQAARRLFAMPAHKVGILQQAFELGAHLFAAFWARIASEDEPAIGNKLVECVSHCNHS